MIWDPKINGENIKIFEKYLILNLYTQDLLSTHSLALKIQIFMQKLF